MTSHRVYWNSCLFLLAILLASAGSATTIVLATDDQLIDKSPVVVSGIVLDSAAVERSGGIWTETTIAVAQVLKGEAGSTVTIREVGGQIGDRMTVVFGTPEYTAGETVLVFLWPRGDGSYQTRDLAVGKFREKRGRSGDRFWVREELREGTTLLDGELQPVHPDPTLLRASEAFADYVRERALGRRPGAGYFVRDAEVGGLSVTADFTLISDPTLYRWTSFDRGSSAGWRSVGTQPGYTGGGVNELKTGMNVWTGYSSANIRYSYSGSTSASPGGLNQANGVNEVIFDDPLDEIDGTWSGSGVVGRGGFNNVRSGGSWISPFGADASHPQKTYSTTWEITEGNLVIQDGLGVKSPLSSSVLAAIIAHEFGHTLGFGHSSSSGALMYPTVSGGASLRTDDQLAARWLYPSGSAPEPTPTKPAAPSGLSASASSSSQVRLTWTDNADNETSQTVYVAVGSGSFSPATTVGAGVESASVGSLSAGKTYRFQVTARNSAGESAGSNIAQLTMPVPSQAVSASFSVSPSSGTAGVTTFKFSDSSTGPVASRKWNFGDGTISTSTSPSHVYTVAGNFSVALTVTSTDGSQSSASKTVSVAAGTPTASPVAADFSFSPSRPGVNQSVSFSDLSTGSPTSWTWDFGDGARSTTRNPSHAFKAGGSYTVTLTARNSTSSSSRSRAITVSTTAKKFTALVPASAQTAGAGSSVWRTELTVFNAGTYSATIEYVFIPSAGGSPRSRTLSLSGNGAVTFENALPELFGISNGTGAIGIEATSSIGTPDLRISSRTFTSDGTGTYGQFVPKVSDEIAPTMYMTGIDSNATFRTNVGLVNRSAATVTAALTLLDPGGATIGSTSLQLGPNTFQQYGLAQLFPVLGGQSRSGLSLRVVSSSSSSVTSYVSIIDNRSQDPVFMPAVARASNSQVIPAVAHLAGAAGTYWRTDVTFYNPTSSTMNLALRLWVADRDNRGAAAKVAVVPPGDTVRIGDVMTWLGAGEGKGAIWIASSTATGPIVTSRTYTTRLTDGATYGQWIPGIDLAGARTDSLMTGLRSDSMFRTNLGFVNIADQPMSVGVTLVSETGATASAVIPVRPKSYAQPTLANLFPRLNTAAFGRFSVRMHSDVAGSLMAYGSVIDNLSGDPIYIGGE